MRVATWNVNSIKQRLESVLAWIRDRQPDILCLQEIKCLDEAFPREAFEDAGYHVAVHGQKTFNGVALLSKPPLDEVSTGLPSGNPVGTEKYPYKLAWMDRLRDFAAERLGREQPLVLAGEYNVIPEPKD